MKQETRIGGVSLNFKHYSGLDLYSDGKVEDEILSLVSTYTPEDYPKAIEKSGKWPVLYHLSAQRGNIIEWIPMTKEDKVLEVGSGCGAITGMLSKKAGSVTCVDLSRKRSQINATRNQNAANIQIHVGNFRDIEPDLDTDYSYICLIGVFEYGQAYIGTANPYVDFLKMLQKHLAPGGRIVIAIENRLGLKYFAGCKEDHLATYFSGIEGYDENSVARTFTRNGLIRIFKSCGVKEYHFYYPYPDYKFMKIMHSDSYQPRPGEMLDNVHNFDNDRMVLFNEKRAYDSLIRDGMYQDFANSFEVILGPGFDTIYCKYSNDRAEDFQIRTEIANDVTGRRIIRKVPLTESARDHTHNMETAYLNLIDRFKGGDLEINDCQVDMKTSTAIFSFVNGAPLSELMDYCLFRGDTNAFMRLFNEYMHRISYRDNFPVADFDLVFDNIMVNGPIWTIIDYEWTYGKSIAPREIAFRAIHNYVLEDRRRNSLDVKKLYARLGLTESDINRLLEEEAGFQKYVTGGRKSMVELWLQMGGSQIIPKELDHTPLPKAVEEPPEKNVIQLYQDVGEGFKEEESIFPKISYDAHNEVTIVIGASAKAKAIRVDPAFTSCMVTISQVLWNGIAISKEKAPIGLHPNGTWITDDTIAFATEDPNITFTLTDPKLPKLETNRLSVTMTMVEIPMESAGLLIDKAKRMEESALQQIARRQVDGRSDTGKADLQKKDIPNRDTEISKAEQPEEPALSEDGIPPKKDGMPPKKDGQSRKDTARDRQWSHDPFAEDPEDDNPFDEGDDFYDDGDGEDQSRFSRFFRRILK